jgi:hypothetical protein
MYPKMEAKARENDYTFSLECLDIKVTSPLDSEMICALWNMFSSLI